MRKRIIKTPCLFYGIILFTWFFFSFASMAAGEDVTVKLTGQTAGIRIYTEDGKREITVDGERFSAPAGIYRYVCGNGAEGYFEVTEDTKEIILALVDFTKVKPNIMGEKDPGNIEVYENKDKVSERLFSSISSDK